MTKTITARELRAHWAEGREIALLDVREEGPFAEAHPLFALSVPVSEIETSLPALVPRRCDRSSPRATATSIAARSTARRGGTPS